MTEILGALRKGALVAQNPTVIDEMVELNEDDRQALHQETSHRWKQPKILYLTVAVNSIAAAIQGWDQTGSNGANLSFPVALGIPYTGDVCAGSKAAEALCQKNSWIIGFINSCPYVAIALLLVFLMTIWLSLFLLSCDHSAAWLSDPINNYIGRKGCIFVAAIFSLLAPIGSAASQTW